MTDLEKFEKLFDDMGIPYEYCDYQICNINEGEIALKIDDALTDECLPIHIYTSDVYIVFYRDTGKLKGFIGVGD